jgi:hypothetical protein
MKTLREVLGKGALRKTGTNSEELKPWVLLDGDEYVPVNRGIWGIELYVEHDMDDERYAFSNDEIDAAVWNPEKQVWIIPHEDHDEPLEIQVVEKELDYKVLLP